MRDKRKVFARNPQKFSIFVKRILHILHTVFVIRVPKKWGFCCLFRLFFNFCSNFIKKQKNPQEKSFGLLELDENF